jgi:5-methylcytosine-specific restriction endonuclease McrA
MPAGAICGCGSTTSHRSKRCDRCRGVKADRDARRRRIYGSKRWDVCRKLTWARDNWTCADCGHVDVGNRGGSLDADHDPMTVEELLEAFGEDAVFDPARCKTRCDRCHGRLRRRG